MVGSGDGVAVRVAVGGSVEVAVFVGVGEFVAVGVNDAVAVLDAVESVSVGLGIVFAGVCDGLSGMQAPIKANINIRVNARTLIALFDFSQYGLGIAQRNTALFNIALLARCRHI